MFNVKREKPYSFIVLVWICPKALLVKVDNLVKHLFHSVIIIGECLDEVRLKNDQIGEISLCGTKQNCKNFESIIGSLQISFTSSQCCHGCGYDYTVRLEKTYMLLCSNVTFRFRCVPSHDIFSFGIKKKEDRTSHVREKNSDNYNFLKN